MLCDGMEILPLKHVPKLNSFEPVGKNNQLSMNCDLHDEDKLSSLPLEDVHLKLYSQFH